MDALADLVITRQVQTCWECNIESNYSWLYMFIDNLDSLFSNVSVQI